MAKKYYAIRKGLVPGIYENWDDAKAQIRGFSFAEYKGFMTREEAEKYLVQNDNVQSEEKTLVDHDRSKEDPRIVNLNNAKIKVEISEAQQQLLEQFVEDIIKTGIKTKIDSTNENEFENICNIHNDVDAVVFTDGSADKDKHNDYQSGKLGFGLALIDIKKKELKKYSYVYEVESDMDIGWLLRGSNDSAEIIAAVTAMRLCKENNYKSIRIYQDNERPAKYFSGEFKNINNAYGDWYIKSSLDAVRDSGIDVQYIYVPAHVVKSNYTEKKGRYDAQVTHKVDFATAIYFNDMVDKLANVENG